MKTLSSFAALVPTALLAFLVAACDAPPDLWRDTDASTDADTDSDSDSDTDADSDSDSDSDTDTDTDSDSDTAGVGDDCVVELDFGMGDEPIALDGECIESGDDCEGGTLEGVEDVDASGTCSGDLPCCINTDECEQMSFETQYGTIEFGCQAEECPTMQGYQTGFQIGCPSNQWCCAILPF